MALPLPALLADEMHREDPVWRSIVTAPYVPLPQDIEAEALAAYDEVERFAQAGQRGGSPDEIRALLAQMKAEQGGGDGDDVDP